MRPGSGVVQWLDDSLVYARTFPEFLEVLSEFLTNMQARNVRLNVKKCTFGGRSAVWCGCHIEDGSWKFEERFYETILQMAPPQTASDLHQAVHLASWLLPTVPRAAEIMQPLRDMLDRILQGRRSAPKEL